MKSFKKTREIAVARTVFNRYINERELAEYSGLSVKTLQSWRLYGRGPRAYHFGKAIRYDIGQFDAWAAQQVCGGDLKSGVVA